VAGQALTIFLVGAFFMASVISNLTSAISLLNSLYNGSSTAPASGEEDYIVWTALINMGIGLWENEEGMLWNELYGKLADAADGTKTTTAGTYTYAVPTNFKFPASGYVWLGTGTNKTAFKVVKQQDLQLYENNGGNWCYFLLDTTPTLEFNPNCQILDGATISYNYYKKATALSAGADTFEMSDPMFAVYYALSELKKEEGDTSALQIASQKMEAMRTKNMMTPDWDSTFIPKTENGYGV